MSNDANQCNACVFIADDYGDNSATLHCQLAPGHDGIHREEFERKGGLVTVTWAADERQKCDHMCGQWRHDHRDESIACPKDADDHVFSDCAFCNDEKDAKICAACGKTHYYEDGHKRHCAKEPYTCEICGESGIGPHIWSREGCPKEREVFLSRGTDDYGDPVEISLGSGGPNSATVKTAIQEDPP